MRRRAESPRRSRRARGLCSAPRICSALCAYSSATDRARARGVRANAPPRRAAPLSKVWCCVTGLRSSCGIYGSGTDSQAPMRVREIRVNDEAAAQCRTAEQERKQHIAAIGQIHFCFELKIRDADRAADEPALRYVSAGIRHRATIDRCCFANGGLRFAASRVHGETHPGLTVAPEFFQPRDMQRGCARASVDLGFDRAQAEVGKRYKLAPTQRRKFVHAERFETRRIRTIQGFANAGAAPRVSLPVWQPSPMQCRSAPRCSSAMPTNARWPDFDTAQSRS